MIRVSSNAVRLWAFLFAISFLPAPPYVYAQKLQVESKAVVGTGWHPWYEVKVDPDNALNVILCGSRWDGNQNALYGFVYASSDRGNTWRVAFEDRSTTWVSEISCAFGRKHMAYLVSEASKVIDGVNHHHLGTTRLFVSTDGGQKWAESSRTAWADYSASAVSSISGNLFTFYNNPGTRDVDRNWGSTIGLLKFSPDGKTVSGPFLDPTMKELNYQGAYPSDAVALKDGTVVALFFGARDTPNGREYDLGLERVVLSQSSSPSYTIFASGKKCLYLNSYSLIYDAPRENLLVAYSEEAEGMCRLTLAASHNLGKTWVKKTLLNAPAMPPDGLNHISLAERPDGALGLLWEDSGNWRFAIVKDFAIVEPPLELVSRGKEGAVNNDSLMTVVYEPGSPQPQGSDNPAASVALNVRAMTGTVWRSSGLVASPNAFYAFSPNIVAGGEGLFLAILSAAGESAQRVNQSEIQDLTEEDITKQVVLLYGGAQSFNKATGILSFDLRLGNRGDTPIRPPILLELKQISSRAGKVYAVNADNGLTGPGAKWDLSGIITGNQIPPGATTYNTFPLSFHIEVTEGNIPTSNLLDVAVRLLASGSKGEGKKFSILVH